jgi:lysophospholipase L1-like esterase
MGDSITQGWDIALYDTANPSINFGVSGQTTSQMLARFQNEVIASGSGIVVILGGINDIQLFGPAANTDNIAAMGLLADQAGIKVILCSLLPSNYPNPNISLAAIESFNKALLALATAHGYQYVDYYHGFLNPDGSVNDSLLVDKLHPNDAGHAVMWKALQPILYRDLP